MKTTIILACMIAAAGSVHAERLASGLEFRAPEGWKLKSNDQAAMLLPPDLMLEPGGKDPSELYIVGLLPVVKDPQDPQLASILTGQYFPGAMQVRQAGDPQSFRTQGGVGYIHRYDAVSQGVALRLQVYAVGLSTGGVAAVIAVGRPALVARREAALSAVAGSLSREEAAPSAGTLAAQWEQRLRGRKLYRFSGYSSSYGSGGTNSQTTLFLGGSGTYEYRRSSSVSVYVPGASGSSASQKNGQGRWRIYEQTGKAFLELVYSSGGTETIGLTLDGTKTLLNGQRWLVGD